MNRDELDGKAKQVKGKVKQGVGTSPTIRSCTTRVSRMRQRATFRKGFGKAKRKVGETIEDIGEAIKR